MKRGRLSLDRTFLYILNYSIKVVNISRDIIDRYIKGASA